EAQDPENYVSGRGVDHYRRYEEDFDLLEELHLNSFRFGIEWARLQPKEDAWNLEALKHYHRYIKSLKQRNIEPMINLWHWTMPTWFTEKGGFEKKANIVYFEQFVQKVIEEFGPEIRYVSILNEPNVYTAFSYVTGEWPPQHKKPLEAFTVYRNLVRAHRRGYEIIKRVEPSVQVGIAMNMSNDQPKRSRHPLIWL